MGFFKKFWHFIWYDDSFLSWVANLVLAFVIVKFLVYPGIGLVMHTSFPIVAVVSGSMEHEGVAFDDWWEQNGRWYEERNITKEQFVAFKFHNGFNMGDIMLLKGVEPKDIKVGDVLVYETSTHSNPIIHRVVGIEGDSYIIKGDNNKKEDNPVGSSQVARTGRAILRLPWLGWIKIWFVNIFKIGV